MTFLPMALGGAAGLDRTAFGQTLLSHPAVAASLAGWIVGAPAQGAWVALSLTLLSASHVPVGAERLRDWTSAAVAACFGAAGQRESWAWGAALLLSLLLANAGGMLIAATRAASASVVEGVRTRLEGGANRGQGGAPSAGSGGGLGPAGAGGDLGVAERAHVACAALHLLRGAVTAGLGAWGIAWALGRLGPRMPEPERAALAGFWTLAPVLGLPLALRLHLRLARPGWLALGLALGLALCRLGGGGAR